MNAAHGCGGGKACGCAAAAPAAAINGVDLTRPGESLDPLELRERAWGELLRQEAVRKGYLPARDVFLAPALGAAEQEAIERMLEAELPPQAPTDEECRRYYEANKAGFVEGRQVHARHILFAVTPGVDVHSLAVRAEQVLLELSRRDADPARFAQLARELSNCPSGADGGELGWLTPAECAEELVDDLFSQKDPLLGMGLIPRLVRSRHGLHVVQVLGRRHGRQAGFAEVRERIAMQLTQASRARALHQYIRVLAGAALVEGVELEGAGTPLVQ